jgi:enterochelin esterase family protein
MPESTVSAASSRHHLQHATVQKQKNGAAMTMLRCTGGYAGIDMELVLNPPESARALVSDLTGMDRAPKPLDPAAGPVTLTLPEDAYFEYAFLDEDGTMHADPANPLRADNPWYPEVSAAVGPAYTADPLYQQAAARKESGRLERKRLESRALGQTRRITIYTPAGHEGKPLPLVLVQDGPAFQRLGNLPRVLDALLAKDRAAPARLVFIEPVDRASEYMWNEAYQQFVLDELLPQMAGWTPGAGRLYLLGASLGGLASATLALRRPELFTGVATLSGAFLGTPSDPDAFGSRESWLLEQLAADARVPRNWFVGTGTLEWLTGVNRDAAAALRQRGLTVTFDERSAGHNWTNWRNQLGSALSVLLQPRTA